MIAAVGCLIVALACQDVERPVGPGANSPKPSEVTTPPVLLSLTCVLDSKSTAISCKPAMPSATAGVNANVIYAATFTYAIFFPYNLVKDTVAHTWAFTAYLQNLLKQSVGTLNGTTVTGVKVFVTDFHATAGSGTVSVANADGTGTFTAPNQPYFNYNQIVAPSGYSANKLWKFNVPNTVTAVSMSILISTDFPAEQNVTSIPPTSIPTWVQADTNLGGPTTGSVIGVKYFKRVIRVFFQPTATLADRQLAVAYVNGAVVGGWRALDGVGGFYVVQVPDDGTGTGVMSASAALQTLPQVTTAGVWSLLGTLYLTPNDGTDFAHWSLNPDSTSANGKKWSLESIDAPYAWGCSVGSYATKIGVIDNGFHAVSDLVGNFSASAAFVAASDTNHHATLVTAILAARGNNGIGITGAMWNATVLARNPSLDTTTSHVRGGPDPYWTGYFVSELASKGARVVNISIGQSYYNNDGSYRTPGSFSSDAPIAVTTLNQFRNGIRQGQVDFHVTSLPLIVIGAGNFNQSGANGTTDAWWSILPRIADSLHDTVLVVGASTQARAVARFSGANSGGHNYVDIMAPGQGVYGLKVDGSPDSASGTSLSAPLVTAAAGLLVSFDSTLGAPVAGHGAPELKQLILEGADSNMAVGTTTRRTVGTYRLLSLYKPLVLAAKRKGAPLCRNRVWLDSTNVVVRRSFSLLDTIYTGISASIASLLVTYHGGNRVDVTTYDQSQNDISLLHQEGAWSAHSRAPLAGYSTSGASQSYSNVALGLFGHSHSGDTLANYRWVGAYNLFTGGTAQIFLQDSTGTGTGRTLTTLPHTGPFVLALAYSPRGDAVFAATGWSWGGYAPPEQITIEYWRVPLNGNPATRIWQSAPRYLEATLSVSEDGSELATDIESYLPGTIFGGYNCWTEYRDATTGSLLDSVTASRVNSHDGVCAWNRHSGSSARVVQGN